MTGRYVWILSFAVWSALASTSGGQTSDIGTILKQFPGYHVVTLQERDPDVKDYIVQHFPKTNASVVHADLDGDGNEDYACASSKPRALLKSAICKEGGPSFR